ncbi:hypothetical protein C2R22_24240 (plasmid) [Salinigranum rubrum]|uniref:Uncharacterized protein n=1 Tax=Salinigranum rubrum TaxID=755307 RepID=A0A2I8VRW4_9EURY|nr:hypothetical protein [Salinigranum rubrum]AUV84642.1 hypothetical protein C2R22_24240 [Salinigranum rubrum]
MLGTLAIVVGIIALLKDVRTQAERADRSLLVVLYPVRSALFAAIAVIFRKLALSGGIVPVSKSLPDGLQSV